MTSFPLKESPYFPFHVSLTLVGEGILILASLVGIVYCLAEYRLKKKKTVGALAYLPSLEELDRIQFWALGTGFLLLTVGLIAGFLWARSVWGSFWSADSKQISSVICWVLYFIVLLSRFLLGIRGRKAAIYSIVCLMLLILSFVAMQYVFPSQHRF